MAVTGLDRRIPIVGAVLEEHEWDDLGSRCYCSGWGEYDEHPQSPHDYHVASIILAALDADASTRPFTGVIPPVRELRDVNPLKVEDSSTFSMTVTPEGLHAQRWEGGPMTWVVLGRSVLVFTAVLDYSDGRSQTVSLNEGRGITAMAGDTITIDPTPHMEYI